MRLTVLGSSSKGNCYLLTSSTGETLILEGGVQISELKRVLGFVLSGVIGCVLSHEHGDHAKYAKDYMKAGIDIYSGFATLESLGLQGHRAHPIPMKSYVGIGHYELISFDVVHDAVDPRGFIISHPEMGAALFVTDTHFIRYQMSDLDHLLIEANFANWILDENVERGSIHPKLAERIRSSHMSIEAVEDFIVTNALEPRNVVLLHLSDSNSSASEFKQEIGYLVKGDVHIADSRLTVNLDKYPF